MPLAPIARRCRTAALAVCVAAGAAPPVAAAKPPASERDAEALAESGDLLGAARLFARDLTALPEDPTHRARRNGLAVKAVNAFTLAFTGDPSRCDVAAEGVALADAYLADFTAAHGQAAEQADERVGMTELRDELARRRDEHGCVSVAERPAEPEAPAAPSPAPPPRPSPGPDPAPNGRGLLAGVVITGALTGVLLATSLGAGLARAREPFTGAAYRDIYDAARASHTDAVAGNEVGYDASTDMCAAGRQVGNGRVVAACDTWDRLGGVTIGASVATGVFAVTTAALAIVRHKQRRRADLRAHRPALAASPGRDGLRLTLQWQF